MNLFKVKGHFGTEAPFFRLRLKHFSQQDAGVANTKQKWMKCAQIVHFMRKFQQDDALVHKLTFIYERVSFFESNSGKD